MKEELSQPDDQCSDEDRARAHLNEPEVMEVLKKRGEDGVGHQPRPCRGAGRVKRMGHAADR